MTKLYIFISLVVVLVNIILSSVVPCLLKENEGQFYTNVKKVFNNNKQLILTNSIILGLTVYIALQIAPAVDELLSNFLGISIIDNESSIDNVKSLVHLKFIN